MNTHPRVIKEKAWLLQAVCSTDNNALTVLKALWVGIMESVDAISAAMIGGKSVVHSDGMVLFPPDNIRVSRKIVTIDDQQLGMIRIWDAENFPLCLSGTEEELPHAAFHVLNLQVGQEIPLVKEFAAPLWDMAESSGYLVPLYAFGLPKDFEVYRMTVPSAESFEQDLLPFLGRLIESVSPTQK